MQRLFDIFFSLIALLVLSPLFLTVISILKITGEGEIFFIQKRHGLNQNEIKLLKFVTMVKNSENIQKSKFYIKNRKKIDFSFFVPMGQESLNLNSHEFWSYFL